jgi:Tol biopolymer transport system component/DNA-binding CsgD family transcriptional regulator
VLTPREWEVLALLREGCSNEEVARRLGISVAGAKYHVSEILSKLGVSSREEAARWTPERRPWWAAAVAPLAGLRRPRFGWLSPAVAGALAVLATVGVGLLVWGVLATGGGGNGEPPGAGEPPEALSSEGTSGPAAARGADSCPGETPRPAEGASNTFAYAAPDETIWLANTDGSSAQQLTCGPTGAQNAAWSSSGRFLAHVDGEGQLSILDTNNGHDAVVDDGKAGSIRYGSVPPGSSLQWSPVEDTLAYEKYDPADPRLPLGIWAVRPGGAPTVLVQAPGLRRLSWSPDGSHIVYELRSEGAATPSVSRTNRLFLMNADGSDPHELTDGMFPSWSPDGRLLAYWKENRGGSSTIGDIYIMDIESGREFSLGEFSSDEQPQWSPDRSRYVFHHLAIDPEAQSATPLFDRPSVILGWSPDGTKVAYIEGAAFGPPPRSLVILNTESGTRTTFHTSTARTAHAAGSGYYGTWSPDGRYYAFVAMEAEGTASSALLVADSDSGTASRILGDVNLGEVSVSYSPDGSRLLIRQDVFDSPSIWIANRDGSGLQKVADGVPLRAGGGEWRPTATTP